MVQVDVFWSYALGASFASAACRQLKAIADKDSSSTASDELKPKMFINKYFVYNLLYLAILFAPSGVYLLWNFPHWETMQVATSHSSLPAWLVVLFAITNVTQGILGYYICYKFIQKGKYFAAHMQWYLGYFFMFFILLYGWDGTGWQRFLYDPTVNNGVLWEPGMHQGAAFFGSNVALTLYGMGVFIVPFLIVPIIKWIRKGAADDEKIESHRRNPHSLKLALVFLAGVFVLSFGSSAVAAIITHYTHVITGISPGWSICIGLPVFGIIAYLLLFRKKMPGYVFMKQLFIDE